MRDLHHLQGMITIEDGARVSSRIVSRISGNIHFVILKWVSVPESTCVLNLKGCFDKVNYKHKLGETWFYRVRKSYYSVSFKRVPWSLYRRVIFGYGIDAVFRKRVLKDKCGSMPVWKFSKIVLKCGNPKDGNRHLRESIVGVLGDK